MSWGKLSSDLNCIEDFVDYLKEDKHYSALHKHKRDRQAKSLQRLQKTFCKLENHKGFYIADIKGRRKPP